MGFRGEMRYLGHFRGFIVRHLTSTSDSERPRRLLVFESFIPKFGSGLGQFTGAYVLQDRGTKTQKR